MKYKKLIKQRKHRRRRRQINDEDINSLSMLTTNYPYVRNSRCMRNSTGFLTNCGPAASNFPCLMNFRFKLVTKYYSQHALILHRRTVAALTR